MAAGGGLVKASVDVVVVTYNSAAHITACLDSIAASRFDGTVHTVVVDNASADDTLRQVNTHASLVQVIESPANLGFAAGCNRGIRATASELVLLLNPDARLEPDTLQCLADYLDRHRQVAIVGPQLRQANGALQPDISATGLFPSFRQALFEYTRLGRLFPQSPWYRDYFLTSWDRRSNRRVAMVQGACFLARRAVLQEIGLLDERFFLYFEETDVCKAAAARHWETHYVGDAAAIHVGSQSQRDCLPSAREFITSLYRFHHKHYGAAEAFALWAILAPYHGLRVMRLAARLPFKPGDPQLRTDLRTARERFVAHFPAARGFLSRRGAALGMPQSGLEIP
jgi:GT2 family glycosyltransferase